MAGIDADERARQGSPRGTGSCSMHLCLWPQGAWPELQQLGCYYEHTQLPCKEGATVVI